MCPNEQNIKVTLEKQCSTCDKTFTTKQLLRNHEWRKHEQFYSPPSSPSFMLGNPKLVTYQPLGATFLFTPNTMAKVSRERRFLRHLARQPFMKVEEDDLLRRAEALTPLQMQKVLEGRGRRVEMKMEWVVKICKEMVDLEEDSEGESTKTTEPINVKTTNHKSSSNTETPPMDLATEHAKKNGKSPLKRGQDKNTESNQPKRRKVELKEKESNEEKEERGWNEALVCSGDGTILWSTQLAARIGKLKLVSPRLVGGQVAVEQVVRHTGLQEELVIAWKHSLAQFIPTAAMA